MPLEGFRPRDWPLQPASPLRLAVLAISIQPFGWSTSMPNDQDLFAEEQSMVTMSFGEHIEELRVRLILALIGLFVGVVIVFIPPLDIGWRVMKKMEEPAKVALDEFYKPNTRRRPSKAEKREKALSADLQAVVEADDFVSRAREDRPEAQASRARNAQRQDAQPADPVLRGRHDQAVPRARPSRSTRAWSRWLRSRR